MLQLVRPTDELVIASAYNPHRISTLALAMDNDRPYVTIAPDTANGAYEWVPDQGTTWISQFYRLVEELPRGVMLVLDYRTDRQLVIRHAPDDLAA